MAVGYNPRTITDGLVLSLDAGSPKNYNAGISTNWTDKVGGNNGTLVGGTYHNDGPFVGAGYVDFNSSGDYLSIADSADLELDTNTTIELFIKFNTIPTVATYIFGKTNGYWLAYDSTTVGGVADRFTFAIFDGSSWSGATNASGGFLPVVNTWYHIAVVKEGTSTKLYVDGTLYGSGTFSGTPADNSNVVSINYSGGTIDADISNVRFIRGTALYTSNFTPPTKPLTAVTNTTLLTCQGNTIADASSSAHTITANGDISLTKEPFAGAGAVKFDGSGDYLTTANHASDFNFGSSDFTMEFWANSTKTGRSDPIGWNYNYTSAGWAGMILNISPGSGSMAWYENSSSRISGSGSWNDGSWHHIAVTRDGNSVRMFLDGTQIGSTYTTSHSYGAASSGLIIGALTQSLGSGPVDGQISNVRVVKGTALYTSAFTPPTRALEPIENTVLLTCQGQNIKDASSNAHTITVNGDAKATIVSSAFEFDGTNDYVSITNISNGTDDFTYEAWVYPIESGKDNPAVIYDNSIVHISGIYNTSGGTNAIFGASTRPGSGNYVLYAPDITLNTWHHIVWVKSGSSLKIYVDGVNQTLTDSGSFSGTQSNNVSYIGTTVSNEYFEGYISNVKIYKGKGLTATEIEQNYNATKGRYA